MTTNEMITIVVALLAGLWTLVQIVAFVREKDPRNLKIALFLMIVLLAALFAFRALRPRLSGLSGKPAATTPATRPASATPTPAALPTAQVKSSFVVDIRRNLLGGIKDIGARCTFAELGGVEVEAVSYLAEVRYQDPPSQGEMKTFQVERTLKDRIRVPAGKSIETEISFDKEIGDLILKSREPGREGRVSLTWTLKDANGAILTSEAQAKAP